MRFKIIIRGAKRLATSKPTMIILAGGMGTRLREHDSSRPKPMVLANGKPFLFWQIKFYVEKGFNDFILSTCYLAEQIENHPWKKEFPTAQFRFYRESTPLGTGGAVQAIFSHFIDLKAAWVVNGDTLLPGKLPEMITTKNEVTYCVLNESDVFDAKPNMVISGDRIIDADESSPSEKRFDAGAVYVTRDAIARCSEKAPFSFHKLVKSSMDLKKVGFHLLEGTCYDIGTPERLKRFQEYLNAQK